jgi:hypothetical protein
MYEIFVEPLFFFIPENGKADHPWMITKLPGILESQDK